MSIYAIHPLTPDRLADVEALFGSKGACGGCFCQSWRHRAPQWKLRTAADNLADLRAQAQAGPPPGLIGYADGEPAAWCQIGPREAYPRILAAPSKQPSDSRRTWCLTCFFIAREQRGQGWMTRLAQAALEYAAGLGAECVEAYPISGAQALPAPFAYVGHAPTLERLGFRLVEVADKRGRTYRRYQWSANAERPSFDLR